MKLDLFLFCFIVNTLCLLVLPESFLLDFPLFLHFLFPLVIAAFIYWFKYRRLWRGFYYLFCGLIAVFYIHFQALSLFRAADGVKYLPAKVQTDFVIDEILYQRDYRNIIVKAQLAPEFKPQRIYVNWQADQAVKTGEKWRGELHLRAVSSRLNYGGFDKQKWYYAQGITAWAKVKSAVKISEDLSLRQQLFNHYLAQTERLRQQGLLMALAFGERAWLQEDVWQIYRKTNTAHLIAISGLHIGLAMLLGMGVARLIQFCLPTRYISPYFPMLSGLVFAAVYAGLAGFAIPTLRALIALVIVSLLKLLRGYCNVWQLFLRVIGVLFIFDPLMVLSNSFWLSVCAVFSLILWYQIFPLNLLEWKGKSVTDGKFAWLFGLIHLQLGLFCLFSPMQLMTFQGISLAGFWANLIIVPLFSFLLVPVILFALFSNGAWESWRIADWLAQWFTHLLSYFQDYWIGVSNQTSWLICCLLCLLLLTVVHFIYPLKKQIPEKNELLTQFKTKKISLKSDRTLSPVLRKYLVSVATLFLASGAMLWLYQQWRQPDWRFETLDVGQGLANLIVKDGRAVLYDTGAGWKNGSMAQSEIIPYLQRQGLILEKVILSHDDNDHSGGIADILQAYPSINILQPSMVNYEKTEQNSFNFDRTFCKQGLNWQWHGLNFQVLAPAKIAERANNTDSCVLLIDDGQYKLLLTGDADLAAEQQFVAHLGKVNVLQVGHHGSRTSTGEALIKQIKPDFALISAGRWNQWGFPHPVVTQRLKRHKSAVYNTAFSGQISFEFYPNKIEVKTARSNYQPWFRQIVGGERD
ncbi:DNA internalization-related competence protein ComEC/Rec2 [[Mannheimia] succiniciproducens]|nr:DNA internalization-related competence protein ComEC/Rec2 [[Mannheimia] succiniciproducens]